MFENFFMYDYCKCYIITFVTYTKLITYHYRPMICGRENDRIYGFGPTLQFMFSIDDTYKTSAKKILKYFNTNYNAVFKYIKRLNYVHVIYKENKDLDRTMIENETSKYLPINKMYKFIHILFLCLFV